MIQKNSQAKWKSSEEWKQGDESQKLWTQIMVKNGHTVLPVYAMENCLPGINAPMLLDAKGHKVLPDLLVDLNVHDRWHEVKSKSIPGWKYTHQRWEHGIDFSVYLEYQKLQSETFPVLIVVHEVKAPQDPDKDSALIDSDNWLWIWLDEIELVGEHRPTWPGGENDSSRRGRHGMGGMLWPRSSMEPYQGMTT